MAVCIFYFDGKDKLMAIGRVIDEWLEPHVEPIDGPAVTDGCLGIDPRFVEVQFLDRL